MTQVSASELEGIVTADTDTAVLIAQYSEAKRAEALAAKRVERLRTDLMGRFSAEGAAKFADASGDILAARVEVQGADKIDIPMLKRLAPSALRKATIPGSKFYRLNIPQLRG